MLYLDTVAGLARGADGEQQRDFRGHVPALRYQFPQGGIDLFLLTLRVFRPAGNISKARNAGLALSNLVLGLLWM